MPDELLFSVHGSTAKPATPITLADAGLKEREDLQEWVIAHPEILGRGVRIVTFEYDRWWAASGAAPLDRLDVLGLDETGHLVVAELKRDKAPDTIEMQAVKYAAMVSRFDLERLGEHHAKFLTARGQPTTKDEAIDTLSDHAEDLSPETLAKPRIVLVASDFPPVVTATVVWLTEMTLDITLIRYQAWRSGEDLLLSVSQLYPVADVEEFTVAPRQETKAAQATKKRTQDTSAVRRLVEAGTLDDGTPLVLRARTEVNADIRTAIDSWVAEEPARGQVTWRNDASAPLRWEVDGTHHSPSGLVRAIIAQAAGVDRSVQGTRWWFDPDGKDLVELSATGKAQTYLSFWTRFLDRVRQEHPGWTQAQIPQPASWFNLPSPLKGTKIGVSFTGDGRLRSEIYIDSGDEAANTAIFDDLSRARPKLEAAFGGPLEFEELPDKKASRVADYSPGDVTNTATHDQYIDTFFDRIGRFHAALRTLGAADG